MEFLQPAWLFALSAAAVPLVLHLVFRRRTPLVDFPTVRFLKEIDVRLARRRRLRELLVLALRCAILAFLAVAIARPLWKPAGASPGPGGRVALAIVLDSTPSMACESGGETRFEAARRAALRLLDTLREGDEAVLLLPGASEPLPESRTDRIEALRRRVEKAAPGPGVFPMSAAIAKASELIESAPAAHKEIAVLSDFQSTSFGRDAPPAGERPLLLLADAGDDSANAFVEFARPLDLPVFARATAEIGVSVGFSGPSPVSVPVSLIVDGRKAGLVTAELRPGEKKTLAFSCAFDAPGLRRVEARMAPHGLPADDSWFFLVHAHDRVRVLVIDGDPSAMPYRDEAFYLLAALSSGKTGDGRPGEQFSVEVTRSSDFPAGPLDAFQVAILANTGSPGDRAREALEAFVARGGGLMAFPGDRSKPEPDPAGDGEDPLFPARVVSLEGDAAGDGEALTWIKVDSEHEVFRPMKGESSLDFSGARFYRVARLEPASGARVIAEHENRLPALVEKRFGAGRVMMFSSTCDVDWNTLPVRTAFLPLLYRCCFVLAGLSDEPEPVLAPGSSVSVPAGCMLEGPGSPEGGRESTGASMSLPAPGFHRVLAKQGPGEAPAERAVLAADTDRSESDCVRMDPAQAARWWGEDRAVTADLDDLPGTAMEYRRGTELAGLFLFLAALCFAAEAVVANRSPGRLQAAEPVR